MGEIILSFTKVFIADIIYNNLFSGTIQAVFYPAVLENRLYAYNDGSYLFVLAYAGISRSALQSLQEYSGRKPQGAPSQ